MGPSMSPSPPVDGSDALFNRYRTASLAHLAMQDRRTKARNVLATTDEHLAAMDQADVEFAASEQELGMARAAYLSQPT